jgi:hypothetical protein
VPACRQAGKERCNLKMPSKNARHSGRKAAATYCTYRRPLATSLNISMIPVMKFLLTIFLILIISCKETGSNRINQDLNFDIESTKCIERIFAKDSVLGEIRNHASENISLSNAIKNYTRKLESMDFTNCPKTFTSSFTKHIEAWKMVTTVSDKYPSKRGELHEIFAELEKSKDSTQFNSLVKQVWDTWNVVKEYRQ